VFFSEKRSLEDNDLDYFQAGDIFSAIYNLIMIIDIRTIPNGHSVQKQDVVLTDEQIETGRIKGPVSCHAQIDRLKTRIFLHITLAGVVEQECSRCLESFGCPVEATCDVVIQAGGPRHDSAEDMGDAECYTYRDVDVIVDIRQSVYEEIMVTVPIKPLCRESCLGLLEFLKTTNAASLEASPSSEMDPRWSALKKLTKDKENF
jgi:uncharacterized protein